VTEKQRNCRCGAIYHRSEAMAPSREIDSFECTVCGATLETWDTAWVPSYRLISALDEGPRRQDDASKTIPPQQS
jgi:hypothetical protein